MQKKNMDYIIKNVPRFEGAFIDAIAKSIEVGIVVPSILCRNLEEAGLKIILDDHESHAEQGFRKLETLYRVRIDGPLSLHPECAEQDRDKFGMVALGAAGTEESALLHAVLGYVRECEVRHDRNAGKSPQEYGLHSRTAPASDKPLHAKKK